MKPIPTGARGSYSLHVESRHLANTFKDSILPPVFSTPYLVLVMENAALNAVRTYLEHDESAVGTRVDVRHLIATPVGREVNGHAEVMGHRGPQDFLPRLGHGWDGGDRRRNPRADRRHYFTHHRADGCEVRASAARPFLASAVHPSGGSVSAANRSESPGAIGRRPRCLLSTRYR